MSPLSLAILRRIEGEPNFANALIVVDSEQFTGWQQLHDSYIKGGADHDAMGFIQPIRIQGRPLTPISHRFGQKSSEAF